MIISNTQISTKNLCDKAHEYHFIRKYVPKELPPALYRGIIGHSALEEYYRHLKDGKSVEECRDAALAIIDREIARIARETPEEFEKILLIMRIRQLIKDYAEVYRVEPFKVLAVEQEFRVPLHNNPYGIEYALRLDLLVEMTSGQYRGDLVVFDHKFVYNFRTPLEIQMDAQLPKYIYTLQRNGYVVTKGVFNQIRTRELKNPSPADLYRREPLISNKAETKQIWAEQEQTAIDIIKDQERNRIPTRVLSLLACRSCMFQDPCKAELNGDDVTQMLIAKYKKSDYGYDLSES